jgi:A/G-specific adenine glycosylase
MSSLSKFTPRQVRHFRKRLLAWFRREQRKLPWRGETDPYRVLVSEIMLQQTRVAVVEDRYKKFLRQFPRVEKLARAREQSVLAAWSGLGYYRRARALHAAAKKVAATRAFPQNADALMDLPGIGRYTSAAVASIAYGEPVAVVDGNVKRVLARLTGERFGEEQNWHVAGELLDKKCPGDFNQAMMELGAMVCVPGKPRCGQCPVSSLCAGEGSVTVREKVVRRKGILRYILALNDSRVLLRQRPKDASLMAGMWELPIAKVPLVGRQPIAEFRHSITTTDYKVTVYAGAGDCEGKWVPLGKAETMALTGLAKKILRQCCEEFRA